VAASTAPEEKLVEVEESDAESDWSWVGWEEGPELETGSLLCPGGDPGAPKGEKWAAEKDSQGSDGGLGTGNEEAEILL